MCESSFKLKIKTISICFICSCCRQDFSQLKVTNMFLKEVLRICPPIPSTERQITEDITIDDITFPAGTCFYVNIYGLHHNEELWEDPEEFKPERFKERSNTSQHLKYSPFLAYSRQHTLTQIFFFLVYFSRAFMCILSPVHFKYMVSFDIYQSFSTTKHYTLNKLHFFLHVFYYHMRMLFIIDKCSEGLLFCLLYIVIITGNLEVEYLFIYSFCLVFLYNEEISRHISV